MKSIADYQLHPRFAERVAAVEAAGSDSVDVFGGSHNGGYYTQQNPQEFASLLCLLADRCRPIKLYGEIGVAAGGTTRLMFENVGFDYAVLIDNGQHPNHVHFKHNSQAFARDHWLYIGDSHSTHCADALAKLAGDYFDVIFIDGDHSYEGVKADIELVRPHCDPATLLVFHDTRCCEGVKKAFEELPGKVAEFVNPDKPLGIGVARI